jgi:hypothetical protein
MTRIHPAKLLHRQIEALAILRDQGHTIEMNIAGQAATPRMHEYARSLRALVERTRLTDRVSFCDWVDGPQKAALLAESTAVMNLSTLPAESRPLAPAEALGLGTPVVATRWNGLPEVIGAVGTYAPVRPQSDDWQLITASAEDVASAILEILASLPSVEACRARAAEFAPNRVLPRFMEICREAADEAASQASGDDWPTRDDAEPAAPATGLLAVTAPLTEMSWNELFQDHSHQAEGIWRKRSESMSPNLWLLVNRATRAWTNQLMAGRVPTDLPLARRDASVSSLPILVRALASGNVATLSSRLMCLQHSRANGADISTLVHNFSAEEQREPAIQLLRCMEAKERGDLASARRMLLASYDERLPSDAEYKRVISLGALARALEIPEEGLARVSAWLDRFPDCLGAMEVWRELGELAKSLSPSRPELVARAGDRVSALSA